MNRAEAVRLLELEEPLDARTVRKAYLRAVKRHRPETDPEGFQRVREAFDLLKRQVGRARRAPSAPSVRAPMTAHVLRPSPYPQPPPVDAPPAPEPPPDELPEPSAWVPPTPADHRAWTVEPLPPPVVSADTLLELAQEQADVDGPSALDSLSRALQALERAPSTATRPLQVLTPVLLLHRAGHARDAIEGWQLVQRWVERSGTGTRLPQAVAARFLLTGELSSLPTTFPIDLRRRLATAILDNDLLAVVPDLVSFQRQQPLAAQQAAEALQHTQNLAGLYVELLAPPQPEPEPDPEPTRRPVVGWIWLLAIVIGIVLAWMGNQGQRTRAIVTRTPAEQVPVLLLCAQRAEACGPLTDLERTLSRHQCILASAHALRARQLLASSPDQLELLDDYLATQRHRCPELP